MSTFLEKYRIYIGSTLVVIVLIGCGVLLWQKQKLTKVTTDQQTNQNSELAQLQKENEDLQIKLKELEDKIIGLEEEKKDVESGKVAGAASTISTDSTNSSNTTTSYSQSKSTKININTDSSTELEELPGVGPTRAQQIISYREENGGFKTIEEIQNIKGIGPKTFEKMRDMITVE